MALTLSLASCHITNSNPPEVESPADEYKAVGVLTITSSGFTKEDVEAKIILGENQKLNIYMYDVKFAAAMPVTIDMVISDVDYAKHDGIIYFSGDSIVPTAGDKPYEKYIIRDLNGRITSDSLILSNKYGETPSVYLGKLQKDAD